MIHPYVPRGFGYASYSRAYSAEDNCAFVRELLAWKQPEFAIRLLLVECIIEDNVRVGYVD